MMTIDVPSSGSSMAGCERDDVANAGNALQQVLPDAWNNGLLSISLSMARSMRAQFGFEAAQDGLERTLGEFVGGFSETASRQ